MGTNIYYYYCARVLFLLCYLTFSIVYLIIIVLHSTAIKNHFNSYVYFTLYIFSWEMGIQTRRSDIVILLLFIYGEGPVMEMNFLLN